MKEVCFDGLLTSDCVSSSHVIEIKHYSITDNKLFCDRISATLNAQVLWIRCIILFSSYVDKG